MTTRRARCPKSTRRVFLPSDLEKTRTWLLLFCLQWAASTSTVRRSLWTAAMPSKSATKLIGIMVSYDFF